MNNRSIYYDRTGQPISIAQWGELLTDEYKRVVYDQIGDVKVSTVWLGIDHSFGADVPIIFETMIFGGEYDSHLRRYATEADAIKGHAEAVEDLKIGMRPWWSAGGCDDDEWTSDGR